MPVAQNHLVSTIFAAGVIVGSQGSDLSVALGHETESHSSSSTSALSADPVQAWNDALRLSRAVMSMSRALIDGQSVQFSSVVQKLNALAQVWKEYNSGKSVTEYNHAAYMQIIGIGMHAMPILLHRLQTGEADWFVAMKYITGADVAKPEMRGNFPALRDAWLKWGSNNGLRP